MSKSARPVGKVLYLENMRYMPPDAWQRKRRILKFLLALCLASSAAALFWIVLG